MKCSICKNIISFGPVWSNGENENICGRCEKNKNGNFIRNKIYEEIALNVIFPCKNEKFGCSVKGKSEFIKNHEAHCQLLSLICPAIKECAWEGHLNEIKNHFKEMHPDLIVEHPFEQLPDIRDNFERNLYFTFKDFHFTIHQKYIYLQSKLLYSVVILDSPEVADMFRYTLKLYDDSKILLKTRPVKSFKDSIKEDGIIHYSNNLEEEFGDFQNINFHLR